MIGPTALGPVVRQHMPVGVMKQELLMSFTRSKEKEEENGVS